MFLATSSWAKCSSVVPGPIKTVSPSWMSVLANLAMARFSSICSSCFSVFDFSYLGFTFGVSILWAPPWIRINKPSLSSSSRSRRTVISETPSSLMMSLTVITPLTLIFSRIHWRRSFFSMSISFLFFFSCHYHITNKELTQQIRKKRNNSKHCRHKGNNYWK